MGENFFIYTKRKRFKYSSTSVSTHHTSHCSSKTCSHFDTMGVTLRGRRTHRQTRQYINTEVFTQHHYCSSKA